MLSFTHEQNFIQWDYVDSIQPNILLRHARNIYKDLHWDFTGGPGIKMSPSNVGDAGLIPGQGAKIPHACGTENQNIKQKQRCKKFNKDFKIGLPQKII